MLLYIHVYWLCYWFNLTFKWSLEISDIYNQLVTVNKYKALCITSRARAKHCVFCKLTIIQAEYHRFFVGRYSLKEYISTYIRSISSRQPYSIIILNAINIFCLFKNTHGIYINSTKRVLGNWIHFFFYMLNHCLNRGL